MNALRQHADEWATRVIYAAFALYLFALALASAFALGRVTSPAPVVNVDALHEQYARGAYDICAGLIAPAPACLQAVRAAMDAGIYEMPSNGWQWPIPDTTKTSD